MDSQTGNRGVPRPIIIAAVCALVVVATAFVLAASRNRSVPYSKAVWDSGKGKITPDNPRLRMLEEVRSRISYGHLTKKQVTDLLGPSEEPIAVKSAAGVSTPGFGPTTGYWGYLLGVRPKSITQPRRIACLVISFDNTGRAQYAYDDDLEYPAGSVIVPAGPYLPKPPKPTVPHASKAGAVRKGP